jgi:hypothetical protein
VTSHMCLWYVTGLQTMQDLSKPVHLERPWARGTFLKDCTLLRVTRKQLSKKQPLAASLLHLTRLLETCYRMHQHQRRLLLMHLQMPPNAAAAGVPHAVISP